MLGAGHGKGWLGMPLLSQGGCAQGCINNAAMSDVLSVSVCGSHIFTHTAAHEMTDEPKDSETDTERKRGSWTAELSESPSEQAAGR